MYVAMEVPECDFTQKQYNPSVPGAGVVVRGASGRACVVMYAGPEYLKQNNITPISYDEAITEAEKLGWRPDF